jgi:hypothetical protein
MMRTVIVGLNARGLGSNNTMVGTEAGRWMTNGSRNVAVGSVAMFSCQTGSNNTCIGPWAGQNWNGNESNNVMIGNAQGVIGENGVIAFATGDGSVRADFNRTIANEWSFQGMPSDERIKTNIKPTTVDALAALCAIPMISYDIKDEIAEWYERTHLGKPPQRSDIGFSAQQIAPHIPDAIAFGADKHEVLPSKMQHLKLAEFVPHLVRAIQQIAERLDKLEDKLDRLEGESHAYH